MQSSQAATYILGYMHLYIHDSRLWLNASLRDRLRSPPPRIDLDTQNLHGLLGRLSPGRRIQILNAHQNSKASRGDHTVPAGFTFETLLQNPEPRIRPPDTESSPDTGYCPDPWSHGRKHMAPSRAPEPPSLAYHALGTCQHK